MANPRFTSGPAQLVGFEPATIAEVAISSGASLSDAADLEGKTLCGVLLPSVWTAAAVTFQVSDDNSTFFNLQDTSGEIASASIGTAGAAVSVQPSDFAGYRFVKVRSGTSDTAVNQAAARTIKLVVRPV